MNSSLRDIRIQTKLFLGFMFVSFFVIIIGYVSVSETKQVLEETIGENSVILAQETMDKIDRTISNRLENFQDYSKGLLLHEFVGTSNEEFLEFQNISKYILKKDEEWTSTSKEELTPFINKILENRLSQELVEKIDFYELKYGYPLYGEVFVTNKYGANVAQTGKTSDYFQADEEWWQKAKEEGLYVSNVEYDESADVNSLDMAIRIEDEEGNFIGVLKVVYNIQEIVEIISGLNSEDALSHISPSHKDHKSLHIELISENGEIIYTSLLGWSLINERISEEMSIELFSNEDSHGEESGAGYYNGPGGYILSQDIEPEEGEILFTYAYSRGYGDFEGLGWVLLFEHSSEDIFFQAKRTTNFIITIVFISLLFSILISYLISRKISIPIIKLKDATEKFAKGDFTTRIKIESSDEIGQLSKTFNLMITDLKKFQDKLLKIETDKNIDLEKKVQEKTSELEKYVNELQKTRIASLNMLEDLKETNEHLKDLDNAKSNFLNIVSHELKTPLTAMFAYLDILDDLKGNLTKDELKAFDAIRRNSKQLKALIDNILEISRIAAGKFELINTKFDLKEKIRGAVDNLSPLAENKGLKLYSDLKDCPKFLFSDEQRLEEIINNLVSNAIKFTEKGSITIKVETSGKFAKISVVDTGVGIPEKSLKQLGKKFYQVDASISRKYGGTGLGLSITKQLAELQEGRIEIKSVEGKGSSFEVYLPLKAKGGNINEKSVVR